MKITHKLTYIGIAILLCGGAAYRWAPHPLTSTTHEHAPTGAQVTQGSLAHVVPNSEEELTGVYARFDKLLQGSDHDILRALHLMHQYSATSYGMFDTLAAKILLSSNPRIPYLVIDDLNTAGSWWDPKEVFQKWESPELARYFVDSCFQYKESTNVAYQGLSYFTQPSSAPALLYGLHCPRYEVALYCLNNLGATLDADRYRTVLQELSTLQGKVPPLQNIVLSYTHGEVERMRAIETAGLGSVLKDAYAKSSNPSYQQNILHFMVASGEDEFLRQVYPSLTTANRAFVDRMLQLRGGLRHLNSTVAKELK